MLEIKDNKFLLNGKKINIYSGAMHYFRTLPEYWEDRLTKIKLCGFNTVETYVCWNLHEPKKGEFHFEGMLDILKFIEIAKKVGLYVIVRPGPYICAEWDFGGLPAWLLKDKNLQLRCNNDLYKKHVEDWFSVLFDMLRPHLESNGGNIIMMQVENEYGSYGNDYEYCDFIKDLYKKLDMNVALFTADGDWCNMLSGGSVDGVYKVLNFGSRAKTAFNALDGFQKDMPNCCGEFWCGWFDHWGEKHHTRNSLSVVNEIKDFLSIDASFNVYMFHGGTNFDFWAGANEAQKYQPTVTSYDYCAFLTEWGDYTPAYHAVRKVMLEAQNLPELELPAPPQKQNVGEVKLDKSAKLFDNLSKIGIKHRSATPESMEHFDQNFGMIYYETKLKGKYSLQPLYFDGVHDRAFVYIDDKKVKTLDRINKKGIFGENKHKMLFNGFSGEKKIGVLVDAMGRVNYGKTLEDRKGLEKISLGNQILFGYDVYCLPLDNLDKLEYTNDLANGEPVFLKGKFKAQKGKECFVHLDNFSKGSVWINGFNIGRYWTKKGPQKALYIPGSLLKENQDNEIVVLDLEGYKSNRVVIDDKPDLG